MADGVDLITVSYTHLFLGVSDNIRNTVISYCSEGSQLRNIGISAVTLSSFDFYQNFLDVYKRQGYDLPDALCYKRNGAVVVLVASSGK